MFGAGSFAFTLLAVVATFEITTLRIVFGAVAFTLFSAAAYRVWLSEKKRADALEGRLENLYSKLAFEIKRVFMVERHVWKVGEPQFINFILNVTNERPEVNTIKLGKLHIDSREGITEGILQDMAYLPLPSLGGGTLLHAERGKDDKGRLIVFSQGIPTEYAISFQLPASIDILGNDYYSDKFYSLELTDSYNRTFKIESKTPLDFGTNIEYLEP
jgi:hypothetical protein